jgi:signal peptidase II
MRWLSWTVIPGLFDLTYLRNTGAAFSLLAGHTYGRLLLVAISLVAVAGLIWYLRSLRPDQGWLRLGLSLVLGGAIGNLIDRLLWGEVIDFILVYWRQHYWPAFNLADSAICVGVGLMLWDMWREERQHKQRNLGERA